MRRDFKLAVLADPGTFINKIVREFGTVTEFGDKGWPADSEAVIFDCAHPEISRHRDGWCSVLDSRMTLGLIGMQAEDRAVLEGIVGRKLNTSIPSIFVRKFPADPRSYRFTILPDVSKVEGMEAAKVAEFLIGQVFTTNSQEPTIVPPPGTLDAIWPLSSQFGQLRGSRQNMLVNWSNGGGWGPPFPPNSGSNATLNALGHFLLANGDQGDGRYHVIILSRLSGVTPLAPDADGNDFGLGLKVTASVGGNLLQFPTVNVNATQPMNANTPVPVNWGNIGSFICTQFSPIPILTQGTIVGNTITTCKVSPQFQEYRSQLTTPGIQNFQVFQLDQPNTSEVQFTMWGNSAKPSNSETQAEVVQLRTEAAEVPSELALGDEDFVIVNYLDFANPGLPSYVVDFEFTLSLYAVSYSGRFFFGQYQAVIPIDLVKATELTVVD